MRALGQFGLFDTILDQKRGLQSVELPKLVWAQIVASDVMEYRENLDC
jgi:hypothetical protein